MAMSDLGVDPGQLQRAEALPVAMSDLGVDPGQLQRPEALPVAMSGLGVDPGRQFFDTRTRAGARACA